MKQFSISAIYFLFILVLTSCQSDKKRGESQQPSQNNTTSVNNTGVSLDYYVHDVGAIPRDIPKTVTVVISNNKPDSIVITGTPTTCDCMKVDLQKKTIPSGDTAHMNVTYNARIPGLFEKDVYIDFIGQDSTLRFTMKGHVKQ